MATRWWDRGRPLVLLKSFEELSGTSDSVEFPAQLSSLADSAWDFDAPDHSESKFGDIVRLNMLSKAVGLRYESGLDLLRERLEGLRKATTDAEVLRELKALMSHGGISDGLQIALKRKEIPLKKSKDRQRSDLLTVEYSKANDGCFMIVWGTAVSRFSNGLEREDFLRKAVQPWADAMEKLDKECLLDGFRCFGDLLGKQVERYRKIADLTDPIVANHGRFGARLIVANYGAAPMMIWKGGGMEVRHDGTGGRFDLPCNVFVQDEKDKAKLYPLEGVYVVGPGEKVRVIVVSEAVQKDIPNGGLIRAHLQQGGGQARARLFVTRRGALGKKVRSEWGPFASGP